MNLGRDTGESEGLLDNEIHPQHGSMDIEKQQNVRPKSLIEKIPLFIYRKRSLFDNKCLKYACCCLLICYNHKKRTLSDIMGDQLDSYWELRSLALKTYDSSNPTHEEKLAYLHQICFGESKLPENLMDEKWKEIGFQV